MTETDDEVGGIVIVENDAALSKVKLNELRFKDGVEVCVFVDCTSPVPTLGLAFEDKTYDADGWYIDFDACPDLQTLPQTAMIELRFMQHLLKEKTVEDVLGDVFSCVIARLASIELSLQENGSIAILFKLGEFEARSVMPFELASDFFDTEWEEDSAKEDEEDGEREKDEV